VCIIDQVNTASIDLTDFMSRCNNREHPVIMLTSGHFLPDELWEDSHKVKARVIHMAVTVDEAHQLLTTNTKADVEKASVTKLLKITSNIGLLLQIIETCGSKLGSEEELRDSFAVRYTDSAETKQILYVLYSQHYVRLQKEYSFKQAEENGMFNLQVENFRAYQSFMISKKDYNDSVYNAFLKHLIPVPLDSPVQKNQ
jgi:hypothetical protein